MQLLGRCLALQSERYSGSPEGGTHLRLLRRLRLRVVVALMTVLMALELAHYLAQQMERCSLTAVLMAVHLAQQMEHCSLKAELMAVHLAHYLARQMCLVLHWACCLVVHLAL